MYYKASLLAAVRLTFDVTDFVIRTFVLLTELTMNLSIIFGIEKIALTKLYSYGENYSRRIKATIERARQ